MDSLYQTIITEHFGFSPTESLDLLRTILDTLVCTQEPLSLRAIIRLGPNESKSTDPDVDDDDYHRQVQRLSSLLTGTQDMDTPITPLHTSSTDFLRNQDRSGVFHVDQPTFNERLVVGCFDTMKMELRFNICALPTSFQRNNEIADLAERVKQYIPTALSYACRFWPYHLSQLTKWAKMESFDQSVAALLEGHVLEWFKVSSLTFGLGA